MYVALIYSVLCETKMNPHNQDWLAELGLHQHSSGHDKQACSAQLEGMKGSSPSAAWGRSVIKDE